MSEAEFLSICQRHDLTFEYSDDHSVWQRGSASLSNVRAAATQLPPDIATRIWNSVVDSKIVPGHRQSFYWVVIPSTNARATS